MKKAEKMNFLYKAGFILLCVCVALFAASVAVMLLLDKKLLGVLLAVAGAALCLTAIILTMCSKPKPPREEIKPSDGESPKTLDTAQ